MSLRVDLGLVRFSAIEKTYYFYDPQHPTAIQFSINGRWESWDVAWVRYHTHDPDIRRIATNAESHALCSSATSTVDPDISPYSYSDSNFSPALDTASSLRPYTKETQPSPNEDYFVNLPPIHSIPSKSQPPTSLNVVPSTLPPMASAPPFSESGSPTKVSSVAPALRSINPLYSLPHENPQAESRTHPTSLPIETGENLDLKCFIARADLENNQGIGQNDIDSAPCNPRNEEIPRNTPRVITNETVTTPLEKTTQFLPLQLHHNRDVKIILSLDGDGVRGLSQVFLVEALVDAICTKVNTRVEPYQAFDLIGGSSMGGLLAVMLSRLRLPAHAARDAYKYIAREVFQNKKNFFSSLDPHSLPLMHDGQAVEDAIKTVVAAELSHGDEQLYDTRTESADVFVVSTQVDVGSNKPALLRSYQSRRRVGPEIDDGMPVWQAMKYAVVAPRYMHPRVGEKWRPVIESGLVDHGTAKNNPVRDALFECRKLFSYTNYMIVIVSIGTGSGLDPDREIPEMAKSVEARHAEAESSSARFQRENEDLMKRGWMKYFRFNVPDLHDVPLEEWCHEDKIRDKTSAYLARPEVGIDFHKCVADITAILTSVPRPN